MGTLDTWLATVPTGSAAKIGAMDRRLSEDAPPLAESEEETPSIASTMPSCKNCLVAQLSKTELRNSSSRTDLADTRMALLATTSSLGNADPRVLLLPGRQAELGAVVASLDVTMAVQHDLGLPVATVVVVEEKAMAVATTITVVDETTMAQGLEVLHHGSKLLRRNLHLQAASSTADMATDRGDTINMVPRPLRHQAWEAMATRRMATRAVLLLHRLQ